MTASVRLTVLAVRTAVPAEAAPVRALATPTAVRMLPRRPRAAPAQQTQGGDDRVEGIRCFGVLRHDPILHAT
ncbi:hypothetical protein SAMN04488591_2212 [Microbacterium azadirachtae]|uniref:Uncharacterized protein n=1 Tax=Microbacterium azadirachtae TaxID=582680 RepID=A0A1I6HW67_9MICO|nr:hypothetical protein SAMN04488591_2212 [Microbacterium azadirachtae]